MDFPLKLSVLNLIIVLYIALPQTAGMRLDDSPVSSENTTANKSESETQIETSDPLPSMPEKREILGRLQPAQGGNRSENYTYVLTGNYRPTNYTSAEYLVLISSGDIFSIFNSKRHLCAGAIIKPNIVITAAHCLKHSRIANFLSSGPTIVAGNGQKRKGDTLMQHPNYHRYSHQKDITMIVLDRELELNKDVQVIPLPIQPFPADTVCTAVGWGKRLENNPTPSNVLYMDVRVLPESLCVQSGAICVAYVQPNKENSCVGEFGGLLVCEGTIAGIKSHSSECRMPGSAAFYTDVYQVKQWILNNESRAASDKSAYLALYVLMSLALWCVL